MNWFRKQIMRFKLRLSFDEFEEENLFEDETEYFYFEDALKSGKFPELERRLKENGRKG